MRRQRAVVWIGALLLACAAALAACTDEIAEAPQEAAEAASVERVDNRAADAQQARAEQAGQQDAADAEPPDRLAAITELYGEWAAGLESLEMQMDVALDIDGFTLEQTIAMQLRLEPLEMYMQIEIADLLGGLFGDIEDEEGDLDAADRAEIEEALATTFRFMLLDNRGYLSLSDEGWVEIPTAELFSPDLSELTGGFSEDAVGALTAQVDVALFCAGLTGGGVLEGELDGAPAWIVSCDVDLDALETMLAVLELLGQDAGGVPGLPVDEALTGIEALSYIVRIDQRSGALLGFDVEMSINDIETGAMSVATSGRVISWNQPIEFPTPEPLIDPEIEEGDSGVYE